MPEDRLILWTAWCHYFGTGEGVTYIARIAFAHSEAQCRQEFVEAFDEFWGRMCEVSPGVIRNEVTEQLFPAKTLDKLSHLKGAGAVEAKAQLHLNFS